MDFKPSVFFEALTSPAFIDGVKVTITLTVVAMAFGLALGLLIAILRSSPWAPVRTAAWAYIWIFRAIPTLVQLLFVWDGLPQLFPTFRGDWFSAFLAASIALSMNEAAYAAEVFRGGLLSIDEGQRLAARALGMSPARVFSKVIAPQLIRVTIPPLSNDFITMLKNINKIYKNLKIKYMQIKKKKILIKILHNIKILSISIFTIFPNIIQYNMKIHVL